MCHSRRHVSFIGFITAVYSVLAIFDEYVKLENSQLKYLLTYKLSQDHIKLFFCAIQSCGGWCPNPTVTQFISAYKRMFVRHQVCATNGNVIAMDKTTFLTVSSTVSKQMVDYYNPCIYESMFN